MPVRLLRGTDSAVNGYYGSLGEVVVNQDNMSLHVLDGVNPGGDEIWNETQVTSYVNQAITSYASGGGLPTSSVTYVTDTDFEAALPNTTGTASDPNTEVIQWDGSKFYIATAPASSGGGGGTNPTSATTTGSVMVWTGSAWAEDASFATQTYVNTEVAQVKSDILGGATAAYDTLQEIKGFIDTNASNIGTVLTNVATKITKPASSTPANHAVRWDASANSGAGDLVNVDLSVYAPKPTATTTTDHAMTWDASAGWQETDLSIYASKPSATTPVDHVLAWDASLGWQNVDLTPFALDSDLTAKAIKPAASSGAGEFLRWDATANSGEGGFISQVPSGGSSGSTIPTPTATTDTANKEVLVWDQTLSSLKHETSDFALVNGATSLTDLAAVETAVNAKADAPPTQSTANTYLYHDGSSWQYGTPVSSGGSTIGTPSAPTPTNDVVKWNGSAFENASISTTGFTTTGFITPATTSGSTDVLQWDGSNFINQPGFATTAYADAVLGNAKPSAATGTNEVVKWNGTAFENAALSTTGFTTTGFITPSTTSGSTDVLQWNGSNFVNQSGFAQIGSASTLTNLGLVETAVNAKADAPPTQTASGTYLYHDGSSWQYGTPSGGSSFGTPTADTISGEMLVWSSGNLINQTAATMGLAPIPTSAEVTGDGEVLGWDGTGFIKKNITVNGSAFTITETANDIILDPNFSVIDAATGVFEITSVNGEYLIKPKASLLV